jgi:lysophospholipase L1-like esterase
MNPNRYPTRPHRRPAAGVLAVVLALVLGLTAAAIAWSAPHADASASGDVFYLSLGDSLAQGAQPIGGPGSLTGEVGYNHGYADELFKTARDGHSGTLRLVKLGCGGETTTSLITGGDCHYPAGSQLAAAVEFLDDHSGQIAFVTIDVGANDIFACGGDPTCFVPQIEHNLPIILSTLRAHAGPDVPIVGMSYYSPDNVAWFDNPVVGEIVAANTARFNDRLERLYTSNSALVADVEGAFAVTDFATLVNMPGVGPVPLSVYNTCTLTWVCTPPPLGPDIHANTDGYQRIADAFAAALDL